MRTQRGAPAFAYPVFLEVKDKLCIVVGGGRVARRKVERLLAAGARVRVVSPVLEPGLASWAAEGVIEHWPRGYQHGDLADGWLVFAATDRPDVNRAVAAEAEARRLWVNVADSAAACTFVVPAVAVFDEVQIAISTSGRHPAQAKRLQERLVHDVAAGTCTFVSGLRARDGRRHDGAKPGGESETWSPTSS
ncbi:hypothetical protein GCM10010885_23600 [Alicyclobacillus cellulosilyticus]|uniref:precorrin-2 dehydrogenase n=1 Tax=Alicyclobacillus cellulosilyticus TaxID=1003997 RepID=A0A917KJC0_9BACL|nr:bifunctional precorrin-2 dehydrogenase/sirohydrochlorin ferrochelatase [Alicyclobacillus cellulosilyticus]GGJ13581.1 hypothetical protein GCM10010885_23600 [Alicyclobacillus cellulosilyticus]